MAGFICMLMTLYLVILFGRILLSWFPIAPDSPVASVNSFLFALTEPVLGPLRRNIPPLSLGAVRLDLSPMIVVFGVIILQGFICS